MKFPVTQRLKHKRLFQRLFKEGRRQFKHPVLALWMLTELPEAEALQAGFSISKKHLKKAHDRNQVKRWMREAYRTEKASLEEELKTKGLQLAVLFITVSPNNISFEQIRSQLVLLLQEIEEQLAHVE